jgi:hypothetical protein
VVCVSGVLGTRHDDGRLLVDPPPITLFGYSRKGAAAGSPLAGSKFTEAERDTKMPSWNDDWNKLTDKPLALIQDRKYKALPGRDDVVAAISRMFKATTSQDTCDPQEAPRGSKATEKDNMKTRNEMFGKNLVLFKKDGAKMVASLKLMLAATSKATEADLYRNLKIVITGSEAFVARMEQHAATWSKKAKDDKSWDEVQEIKDPIDKKAAQDMRALEISLRDLKASLNASLRKALAVVQRIKADPTPATYKTEMDKGGRDLYMSLVAAQKIKADTKLGVTSKAKKIPSPGTQLNDIKQYGESAGLYRTLPDNATANQVQDQVKQFNQLVKLIATNYAGFLKS